MNQTTIKPQVMRAWDYLALNVYWFAISFLWNSIGPILLPVLVVRLVPESQKGGALGTLSALGLVIAMIVQPLAGAWTDARTTRWGKRRPFIVGGTLADVIFLTALLLAPDFATMLIAYVLLQTVSNIAHGPYQAYIPDLVPEIKRGAATGIKQVLEFAGIIVTSLVIGNLVGLGRLDVAFGAIIAILLLTMAITARFVSETPFAGATPRRAEPRAAHSLWRTLFLNRDFTLWLVSRLFIVTGGVVVRNYIYFFMQDVLQIENPGSEIGMVFAFIGIATACVTYPAGMLSDRWGRKPLILAAGILGALGTMLLSTTTSIPQLLIYGAIIGAGMGIFLSVNWAWGTDLIPSGSGGRMLGMSNLANAGSGVLTGMSGFAFDYFNAQSTNSGFGVIFLGATVCYVIGTALAWLVQDTR
ncbi:MAG: MFS transporter [Chloroflexi bacterium]|nr:MFS transporter [Chloroflexota bacterium]